MWNNISQQQVIRIDYTLCEEDMKHEERPQLENVTDAMKLHLAIYQHAALGHHATHV